MKDLKNTSAFKITLLIIINLFFHNWILIALSCLFLIIEYKKKATIVFIIFFICYVSNNLNIDFIPYGIVEEVNSSYIIVDKILYKNKIYTKADYEIGYIVKTNNSEKSDDESLLKYNYRFINNNDPKVIYKTTPRYYIYHRINDLDIETQDYLKRIIYNSYDNINDIEFIGYGFSFYFLLILIKRKSPLISLIVLIFYILFFKFDIKFYLIIGGIIADKIKIKNIKSISFRISFILLINQYLLLNKSIWISLGFSLIYLLNKENKTILMLFQSLCFNQISIGLTFFYNLYIGLRIGLFIFSILTVFINPISVIYLKIILISSKIIKIMSFGIRGKLNCIGLIFYLIILRFLKNKSNILKYLILIILLITPINNPIKHLNFIDVGQGNATLIHGQFGKYNILVDTGSKYNYSKLKNALFSEGVYSIDYLIISHEDEDHSGNIENLKKDFNIKEIVYEGKDINIDDCYLKYLNLGTYDNDNDNSLVYLVNIDDRNILLPGDISKNVENIIINKYEVRNIDILDIGHHGSSTSSSSYFIGSLNPEFVVISTNGKYNHPHKETIDTLDSYKLEYLITKKEGSIRFFFTSIFDICISDKRIELF